MAESSRICRSLELEPPEPDHSQAYPDVPAGDCRSSLHADICPCVAGSGLLDFLLLRNDWNKYYICMDVLLKRDKKRKIYLF